MSTTECPKCGGEMRPGELSVSVTMFTGVGSSIFGMTPTTGMGLPRGEITEVEPVTWREKTGRKTGMLIKSDEVKTMRAVGRRCSKCSYIEIYAKE